MIYVEVVLTTVCFVAIWRVLNPQTTSVLSMQTTRQSSTQTSHLVNPLTSRVSIPPTSRGSIPQTSRLASTQTSRVLSKIKLAYSNRFLRSASILLVGQQVLTFQHATALCLMEYSINKVIVAERARVKREDLERELTQMVNSLAASMRSGMSLFAALKSSQHGSWRDLADKIVAYGHDQGLEEWSFTSAKSPLVGSISQLLQRHLTDGISLLKPLDELATKTRRAAAMHQELKALTTQATSSAALLAVLPLVFMGLSFVIDSSSLELMFSNGVGSWLFAVGVSLEAAGIYWMHSIINKAGLVRYAWN